MQAAAETGATVTVPGTRPPGMYPEILPRSERIARHNADVAALTLPIELQQKIWLYLPVVEIFRQQLVCFQWKEYAAEDTLWRMLHNQYVRPFAIFSFSSSPFKRSRKEVRREEAQIVHLAEGHACKLPVYEGTSQVPYTNLAMVRHHRYSLAFSCEGCLSLYRILVFQGDQERAHGDTTRDPG